MKKSAFWLSASAIVMVAIPWLTVTLVKGDAGMAVCFLLFFAFDPVYAICAGAYAGGDIRRCWFFPIVTAAFFLAGTWLCFDPGETAFVLYALGYLLLGMLAMLIPHCIRKKKKA